MNTSSVLIALIRREICGNEIPEDIRESINAESLLDLFKLSKAHDMAHIVAKALDELGLLGDNEISKKLKKQMMLAVLRYHNISYELEKLIETLETAEIDFIPLKGSVLREYYNEPWMRTSSDIDILVKKKDLERAVQALNQTDNYEVGKKNFHDISLFSQSGVHIELHFDLIEEMRHPTFGKLFSEPWSYAHLRQGQKHYYLLENEFFYFYHVAHMVKHFEEGGCGIRPFIDIWIMDNSFDLNFEKLNKLLNAAKLMTFTETSRRLSEVWFANKEHNKASLLLERFIIDGGAYGTHENKILSQEHKKGGRFGYFFAKIFPPYSTMKLRFPVLKKHCCLLPFFYIYRWFWWLFKGNTEKTISELKANKNISDDKIDNSKDIRSELGLNY